MRPHEHLDYDPRTGDLRWKAREPSDFKTLPAWKRWCTMFAGAPAGFEQDGCLKINFHGKSYQAGRIAYEIHNNTTITKDSIVQYADNNPFNLRAENLRIVPRSMLGMQLFEKYGLPPNRR